MTAVLSLHSKLGLRLHEQVLHCYSLAEGYYLKPFPRPEVLINLKGRSAGIAELQANRLRFNAILLRENTPEFLSSVIPHEVAHLLAWQLYGAKIRPHGKEWQQIMQQVFNLVPSRTHNFDIQRAAKLDYFYTCACINKKHALTLRRHNKITRGQTYICLTCKSNLHYLGTSSNLNMK